MLQGDLYSPHFLVRKAQGGCKYIDWEHAILHKLEGDFRNAKMWYTDMRNSRSCPAFHDFWEARASREEEVATEVSAPISAARHTDHVAMWTDSKLGAEKYYEETTASAEKIEQRGDAMSLDELQELASVRAQTASSHAGATHSTPSDRQGARLLSARDTASLLQLELLYLLHRLVRDFGWRTYNAQESVQAYEEQAKKVEQGSEDDEEESKRRKEQARDMITGSSGNRKF